MKSKHKLAGFALIEVFLVVAIIGILLYVSLLILNPNKQLAATRNSQRYSDINQILNAMHQYAIDQNKIPFSEMADECIEPTSEICVAGAEDCSSMIDISYLTENQTYLTDIPKDPLLDDTASVGTGYHIARYKNGGIVVCAPLAEDGRSIAVIR